MHEQHGEGENTQLRFQYTDSKGADRLDVAVDCFTYKQHRISKSSVCLCDCEKLIPLSL